MGAADYIWIAFILAWTPRTAYRQNAGVYGIRPEDIAISNTAGLWPVSARDIGQLGSDAILHCNADHIGPIVVRTTGDIDIDTDKQVWLPPMPGKEHRFAKPETSQAPKHRRVADIPFGSLICSSDFRLATSTA
jgi:ABC-type sugar transport system ATPase subunit